MHLSVFYCIYPSENQTTLLISPPPSFLSAYVVWGLLFSVQPPIYPKEAEDRGAKPSQVRYRAGKKQKFRKKK